MIVVALYFARRLQQQLAVFDNLVRGAPYLVHKAAVSSVLRWYCYYTGANVIYSVVRSIMHLAVWSLEGVDGQVEMHWADTHRNRVVWHVSHALTRYVRTRACLSVRLSK